MLNHSKYGCKKKFLILAMIVGFMGLALGSYTMYLSINDMIKPGDLELKF